jgi:hypothetical protein
MLSVWQSTHNANTPEHYNTMDKELIAVISIAATTILLIFGGIGLSRYMELKTAMENGYEQVLEPGISSPIWRKKL